MYRAEEALALNAETSGTFFCWDQGSQGGNVVRVPLEDQGMLLDVESLGRVRAEDNGKLLKAGELADDEGDESTRGLGVPEAQLSDRVAKLAQGVDKVDWVAIGSKVGPVKELDAWILIQKLGLAALVNG